MAPDGQLVPAAMRAVQRADSVEAVRRGVCEAAVDVGYEFACFDAADAFVTASQQGVQPPDEDDATPTFRSAAADARPDADSSPGQTADVVGEAGEDGDRLVVREPTAGRVTCIERADGYTVTVPVVDDAERRGTLALGAPDRVTDDDERDRLLAAGTVVGQGLARAEASRERDRLRETLKTERRQFEKLHSVAAAMVGCEEPTNIYHLAIDAAENILEFDICGIDVVEDGYFVPIATSTGMESDGYQRLPATEGVAGETYQENDTIIVDDVDTHPLAEPANPEYKSVLSVPIEDVGIFQAASAERGAFTTTDAELVELLMAHVSATIQRLRSDEALRESEQKYRTLIEQSHDAVAIYQDGGFAFANARATSLFDRERDALLSTDACELFHPEDRPKLERVSGELAGETGRQQTFEARIRRPNGDLRFCEFSATSITYDGDVAVLASIRDITERKDRERDLQRQNERLDEFASVVSHDLRSPINVARGSVELAEDTGDLGHLERAAAALDRMEALVEDILRLARQGQLVDETDRVSIEAVAADAWRSVDAADATLDVATDASVDADRTRLQELFENLFRNAVEHGSTGNQNARRSDDALEQGSTSPDSQARQDAAEHGSSDVTVTVTADGDGFAVTDDGRGLPADSHGDVFERGFTSAEDGTGFGLAIVESIADAHGWTVDAVSPGDGDGSRGARFEISGCSPE